MGNCRTMRDWMGIFAAIDAVMMSFVLKANEVFKRIMCAPNV